MQTAFSQDTISGNSCSAVLLCASCVPCRPNRRVLCCVPPKQARLQVHSLRVDEQAGAVLEAVRRWPAEYTFAGEAQH